MRLWCCGRGRRDRGQQSRHAVEERGERASGGWRRLDAQAAVAAAFNPDGLE